MAAEDDTLSKTTKVHVGNGTWSKPTYDAV